MKVRVAMNQTGATGYINLIEQETGLVWNGSALVAFVEADQNTYAVSVQERGDSKVYEDDVPDGLPAGKYDVIGYIQSGGSPDMLNDSQGGSSFLDYPGEGGTITGTPLGTMTGSDFYDYLLRHGLLRTDMEDEVYECLTDTVQEIEQLHDFDERQAEETVTDTINSLGDYKMDVETDTGLLLNVVLVDGNYSKELVKLTKADFDLKYPAPATQGLPGRPQHWCFFAGQILVGPRPDQTSYTYRQVFSTRLTTALTAVTTIPFSSQYREVLKDGTLWRIYLILKNRVQAQDYAAKYEAGLERIIDKEKRNQDAGGNVAYQGV